MEDGAVGQITTTVQVVCSGRIKLSIRYCDNPKPEYCGHACGEENVKYDFCASVYYNFLSFFVMLQVSNL